MFKVVRDHPKVLWTIIILIILVSILSVYEKQKYKANPYENQIGNPPREDKVFNDTYYYEKLSDNASLQFILTLILHLNLKRVIIQKKS